MFVRNVCFGVVSRGPPCCCSSHVPSFTQRRICYKMIFFPFFLMVALFCLGESLILLWLAVRGQLLVFESYSSFLFCVLLQVFAAYRATQVCLTWGLFSDYPSVWFELSWQTSNLYSKANIVKLLLSNFHQINIELP